MTKQKPSLFDGDLQIQLASLAVANHLTSSQLQPPLASWGAGFYCEHPEYSLPTPALTQASNRQAAAFSQQQDVVVKAPKMFDSPPELADAEGVSGMQADNTGPQPTLPKTPHAQVDDTDDFEDLGDEETVEHESSVLSVGGGRIALQIPPPPTKIPAGQCIAPTPRSSTTSSPSLWQYPHVYSSCQLFPHRKPWRKGDSVPDDKVVFLATFFSRCYVTCHAATPVELDRYLPLLKYARDGAWHFLPSPEQLIDMANVEHVRHGGVYLAPSLGVMPAKQDVPWVHGGAALRTADTVKEIPCENPAHAAAAEGGEVPSDGAAEPEAAPSKRKASPPCRRCGRAKQAALRSCDIVYYSVVKTTIQPRSDNIPPPPPFAGVGGAIGGQTELYKIVRNGSRDAAAAQAFYSAGAEGHSTVFTCAVREDVDWTRVAEDGIKRVNEPWQLVDDTNGPISVFY